MSPSEIISSHEQVDVEIDMSCHPGVGESHVAAVHRVAMLDASVLWRCVTRRHCGRGLPSLFARSSENARRTGALLEAGAGCQLEGRRYRESSGVAVLIGARGSWTVALLPVLRPPEEQGGGWGEEGRPPLPRRGAAPVRAGSARRPVREARVCGCASVRVRASDAVAARGARARQLGARSSMAARRRLLWCSLLLLLAAVEAVEAAQARPRACSAAARALAAAKVFEGAVRSRSVVRRGAYNATFVVRRVWKGARQDFPGGTVRLHFSEHAHPACREPGEPLRASISRAGAYIVFVGAGDALGYSPLGEPLRRSRQTVRQLQAVLCSECVKPLVLLPLGRKADRQVVRLTCRLKKGAPLPTFRWYKDGRRILPTNRTKIMSKKKRSVLTIASPRRDDAGNYTCRAVSITSTAAVSTNVSVPAETRADSQPCARKDLCLNDGKCSYIAAIGEWYCECAEGFKGQRCESKDVSNQSSAPKTARRVPARSPRRRDVSRPGCGDVFAPCLRTSRNLRAFGCCDSRWDQRRIYFQ
ncbi:uncharacterized protein LOC134528957 [Bacillus rossius redtenbacheri]|uniref:uncharacterized protein LOC134528957 n=1 Tax=Bacillus rossius redtenbacheri TaxID=93214 RepID=UPI002FDED079